MNHKIKKIGFESKESQNFPSYLMYDITNCCNARCTHCPQSSIKTNSNYKPEHLSWKYFKKTIDEANHFKVDVVRITGDGEPLLHPDIHRFISYAKDLGFPLINLTTNGSLLSERKLSMLLRNPPHVFDISVDAFSEKTYQKIRVGLDFETVKDNILRLLMKRNPNHTKVLVSMIRRPETEHEIDDFKGFWEDKVDFVAIREMHTNLGLSGSVDVPEDFNRWPCPHLWQRLVVDYRGSIRYCPVDWQGASMLGHVDDTTLYQAWHCSHLEKLRDYQKKKKFENCDVCSNCSDWIYSPWDRGWLKLLRDLELKIQT